MGTFGLSRKYASAFGEAPPLNFVNDRVDEELGPRQSLVDEDAIKQEEEAARKWQEFSSGFEKKFGRKISKRDLDILSAQRLGPEDIRQNKDLLDYAGGGSPEIKRMIAEATKPVEQRSATAEFARELGGMVGMEGGSPTEAAATAQAPNENALVAGLGGIGRLIRRPLAAGAEKANETLKTASAEFTEPMAAMIDKAMRGKFGEMNEAGLKARAAVYESDKHIGTGAVVKGILGETDSPLAKLLGGIVESIDPITAATGGAGALANAGRMGVEALVRSGVERSVAETMVENAVKAKIDAVMSRVEGPLASIQKAPRGGAGMEGGVGQRKPKFAPRTTEEYMKQATDPKLRPTAPKPKEKIRTPEEVKAAAKKQIEEAAARDEGTKIIPASEVQDAIRAGEKKAGSIGKAAEVREPDNPKAKHPVRYEVVELDDIVASHDTDLKPNAKYGLKELQNRDRGRAAGKESIDKQVREFDPDELLNDGGLPDHGSPILGDADNMAEGGNGRTITMRRAAKENPEAWKAYQAKLRTKAAELGIDPKSLEGMKNPVLVRRRTAAMSPEERVRWAKATNKSAAAPLSAVETAKNEAGRMKPELLADFDAGEGTIEDAITSARNAGTVRKYLESFTPEERATFQSKTGALSQEGVRKIKNAIFAASYGEKHGSWLVDKFLDDAEETARNVGNALTGTASKVGELESAIKLGMKDAKYGVAEDIAKATRKFIENRDSKTSLKQYMEQAQIGARELTPTQEKILGKLDEFKRSPARLKEFINGYVNEALKTDAPGQKGMFGEVNTVTKDTLLDRASKAEQEAYDLANPKKAKRPKGAPKPKSAQVTPSKPAAAVPPPKKDVHKATAEAYPAAPDLRKPAAAEAPPVEAPKPKPEPAKAAPPPPKPEAPPKAEVPPPPTPPKAPSKFAQKFGIKGGPAQDYADQMQKVLDDAGVPDIDDLTRRMRGDRRGAERAWNKMAAEATNEAIKSGKLKRPPKEFVDAVDAHFDRQAGTSAPPPPPPPPPRKPAGTPPPSPPPAGGPPRPPGAAAPGGGAGTPPPPGRSPGGAGGAGGGASGGGGPVPPAPPPAPPLRNIGKPSFFKSIFGTREEWMQSKLGSKHIGSEAHYSEARGGARMAGAAEDVAAEVAEKLTDDSILAKYLPKRVAQSVSNALRKLPFDLGHKFGVTPGRQRALFDAMEGIKELDAAGQPVLGTKIYDTDPATGQKVWNGVWRHDPAEATKLWNALSPKEQEIAKWATRKLEHEKVVDNITSSIEGYMRHYEKGGLLNFVRRTMLRHEVPGFMKKRSEAGGFIQNFEESLSRRLQEGVHAREYNKFIDEFTNIVTEAIPANGAIPEGWVKVPTLQATRTGKGIAQLGGGRMIPAAFKDEFVRMVEPLSDVSKLNDAARRLGAYWKANMLTRPGTALRNLYSGVVQYATEASRLFFKGAVSGDVREFGHHLKGLVKAFSPDNVRNLPASMWGGKGAGSSIGQFGKGEGLIGKAIDVALMPMGIVENYFKRASAIGKMDALGIKIDKATIRANDKALNAVIDVADRVGYDYRNIPEIMRKLEQNPLGALTLPFLKWPYKTARMIGSYTFGAFAPGLSASDRFAKLATAFTMGGAAAYWYGSGSDRRFFEGMNYDLDTTGRAQLGKDEKGRERWIMVKDQPWINAVEAAAAVGDVASGRGWDRLSALASDTIGEGPFANGLLALTGKGDRWDQNLSTGAKLGRAAKGFIPFQPWIESFKRQGGGLEKTTPETFWEGVSEGLPFVARSGKPKVDQYGQPVLHDADAAAMAFWLGMNIKHVDVEAYSADRLRVLGNAVNLYQEKAKKAGEARSDAEQAKYIREMAEIQKKIEQMDPEGAKEFFSGIDTEKREVRPGGGKFGLKEKFRKKYGLSEKLKGAAK